MDTTVGKTDCTYDRIITPQATGDYKGISKVFRFDKENDLSSDMAVKVSDHYPV